MMKPIKSNIKQNLLKEKKRNNKAAFVTTESEKTKKFKYKLHFSIIKSISGILSGIKNSLIKTRQRFQLLMEKFDWKLIKRELREWMFDAVIQGLLLNFIVYFLFGLTFNLWTLLAYGFLVKQSLYIIQTIKQYGTNK